MGLSAGNLTAQEAEKTKQEIQLHPSDAKISGTHNQRSWEGTSFIQLVGKARMTYRFQVKQEGHYDFFMQYGEFSTENHRNRVQCFLDGEPAGTTFAPDHPPQSNASDRPRVAEGRLHVQKRHLTPGTHTLELRSLTWYGTDKPTEWFGPITIRPSSRPGPVFSKQDFRHVDHDPRYGLDDRYAPDVFNRKFDLYDAKNLLGNGSFEHVTDRNIAKWTRHGNVQRTKNIAREGKHSITVSSDDEPSFVLSDPIPIQRDQRYEIEAWYRLDELQEGHADVMLIWRDSTGNIVGTSRAGRRLHLEYPDHRTFNKTGWFNLFHVFGPEKSTGYNQSWEDGTPEIPENAVKVQVKARVKKGTVHFDQLSVRPYTRATFRGGGSLAIPRPISSKALPGSHTFHVRLQKGSDVVKQVDRWRASIAGQDVTVKSSTFQSSNNHWKVQLKFPELTPGRHFVNWTVKSGNTVFKPKGQLWVHRPSPEELVIACLTDTHYDDPLNVEFPWHEAMGRSVIEQMNQVQPDVVSYLGDYSAGPHRKPYTTWRDLHLANAPMFLGTGNHENDNRNEWIFSKFFGRWKEERETGWYEQVQAGNFSFITLDGNYLWSGNHSLTNMDDEQLDWFQKRMENTSAGLHVVMDEASIRMRNWRNRNVGSSYHASDAKDALQRLRRITESHRSLVLQGDRHQGSVLTKGKGTYLQVPAPARSFGLYKYAGFGLVRARADGTLPFCEVVGLYGENSSRTYHYTWKPKRDVFPWDIPVFEIQQPNTGSLDVQIGDTIGYENFPVVRRNHGLWGPGRYTIHSDGRVILGLQLPRLYGTHSFRRQGELVPSKGVVEANVTNWTPKRRRMKISSNPGTNRIRLRLTDLPRNTAFTVKAGDQTMTGKTDTNGELTVELEQDFSNPTLVKIRPN